MFTDSQVREIVDRMKAAELQDEKDGYTQMVFCPTLGKFAKYNPKTNKAIILGR